jgi:signal transduction histidine kinase
VGHLADEQAALRRVATLVARGSPPEEVFRAVAEEVAGLLGVAKTMLLRYEDDGTATAVGGAGEGCDVLGAPDADATGTADYPVVVGGRLWGCLVAATEGDEPMPAAVEARMGQFTDLVATSIANVQAHAELEASRARIVAATDEERRRVVRDLHDGAQQRLVHTVVTLKLALRALTSGDERVPELVGEALEHAQTGMVELRELAHGILPAVLNRGGLRAGVEALAARMPVPVDIEVSSERFPAPVEATAYFVVAEALTNVAKHAHADHATVVADVEDGALRIEIADDGTGSADPNGHGLLGLADRLASLDGKLQVMSVPGAGTKVAATVPVGVQHTPLHPVR